jgi:membrane associated rhomboid family serine protease
MCAFHPDRRAGVVCQRCDKPICPACMTQAAVGFHCPDCVRQGRQRVVRGRAAFGATQAPLVTYVVIGINVAVFLYQLSQPVDRVLFDYGLNGGAVADGGEWWRLVTSAFLHVDILHLALNMIALWIIGPLVERMIGRLRFALIYGVSLMAGAAGAVLVSPRSVTAGASGAIYGLLGALVILFRIRGISLWQSGLGLTLLINFVFTVTYPHISIGGHIGGFVGGLSATWLLVQGVRRLRAPQSMVWVVAGLVPVFFLIGLWASTTWTSPVFGS